MDILSAENLHILSQRTKQIQTIALNVDNYDWWPYMPWWNIADDSAYISWPRSICWEAVPWSFTASYSQGIVACVCVRWCASGFLRYLSPCHCGRSFFDPLGQSVKGSKTPLVCRTWRRKPAYEDSDYVSRQPYVITPGFFPCRHHAMSKTIRTVGL